MDSVSLPSSPGLVGGSSAGTCSGGEPFVPLSVTDGPHKFWHNGKTMDASHHSRFGVMSQVLTEGRGAAVLMSYLAAFPARTSARQARAQASTASAPASGQKWHASFARYDRDSSSWKTRQHSLLGGLDEFSGTWPRWGLMRAGECWEQQTLAPITEGKGSGLLPTPSGCRSGKNHVCGRLDEWGGSSNPWRGTEIGKTKSPTFEEWMLGWPEMWTVLTPLGMGKFQQWQQQHSGFCQGDNE